MPGASSGILVHPDALNAFTDLSKVYDKRKYDYVVFKIAKPDDGSGKEAVIVDRVSEASGAKADDAYHKAKYEELLKYIYGDVKKECRYIAAYVKERTLAVIHWAPDVAPIKAKMTSASTWDTIKNKFQNGAKHIEANDADEISHREVVEAVASRK